ALGHRRHRRGRQRAGQQAQTRRRTQGVAAAHGCTSCEADAAGGLGLGSTIGLWLAESVACCGARTGLLSKRSCDWPDSFSGARTSPWVRRALTCSSTGLAQLPSTKSARCSSPFFRSRNRLSASPRLRLLLVVRRAPTGRVDASTFSVWLFGGRPQ